MLATKDDGDGNSCLPSLPSCTSTAVFKGENLDVLRKEVTPLPPITSTDEHKVFIDCKKVDMCPPPPYPPVYTDRWSEEFVRMPCSPKSLYPSTTQDTDGTNLVSRWTLITTSLGKPISSSYELQDVILSYNARFKSSWNFGVLHKLFEDGQLPTGSSENFFRVTLPAISALAINLPIYLTKPIPLLRCDRSLSLTLSQLQVASLLANAFFCTFPRRNSVVSKTGGTYPAINFASLLSLAGRPSVRSLDVKCEKLRCLLHYFHRVTDPSASPPAGNVTFTRRCLGNKAPDWLNSQCCFADFRLHINPTNTIEGAGPNTLQVDFANRFLGGGVLRTGCVQEEIMFVLRPELLASCLFTESLQANESMLIEGAEQFSTHSGYGNTFKWTGDYNETEEKTGRDKWNRWRSTTVAIDATNYRGRKDQFYPNSMLRELNKAYCGFTDDLAPNRKLPPVVATGNWGCGAFAGNVQLKVLLQMMACLQAGKAMAYYTFHDVELCDRIFGMYQFLVSRRMTVGDLWRILTSYHTEYSGEGGRELIFDFVRRKTTSTVRD